MMKMSSIAFAFTFLGLYLLYLAVVLAVCCGLGFVAWHFLAKVW